MEILKIQIIKCSSPFWWYVDHIGEVFTVYHQGDNYIIYQEGWKRIGVAVYDACVQ